MAQYDGSIRINTQINVKSAEAQLGALEVSISKSANKIADLRAKLDSLKTAQIPTQEYSEIAAQIEKAKHSLDGLLEKQERMQSEGKTRGTSWERINSQIAEARSEISYAKGELQALVDEGKAFTIGDPAQEEKLSQQLQAEEARLASMTQKRDLLNSKVQAAMQEEARLASIKENATVSDQKLVDLLERRRQLLAQIRDMEKAGVTEGYAEYDTALADLSDVQGQINGIRNMRDAAAQARESYVGLKDTVKTTFKTMARGMADIPIAAVKAGVRGLVSGFQKLGSVVKNVAVSAFQKLGTAVKASLSKAGSLAGNLVSKFKTLGSSAKKSFGDINKSAKKTGGLMGTIASRFKGIALSLLLFNWITKAFNGAVSAIKEGFSNLYTDNERFQKSVDELKASVLTLKNAFAAAFRPLVDIAIPYIQMAADKMAEFLNMVGQFTAAITGQKTYTKAIKQTADAFKDAKKAAEGYLSPLDEINKYSDGKNEDEDENQYGQMFEELPVEQKFLDMAEKVKDVFKDIFSPIKEAWEKEGQFVIDSWKYGLDEVWKLIKDIERDFLTVWQQEATISIFQDILHIIGDIGLVAGNLARNFREAWNENEVGLHILEKIRDIIGIIVGHIKNAADATVEWSDKLDFYPLLDAFNRFLESLEPVVDAVSGILEDFYTKVMLPLGTWVIEKGLPELLQVFIDFNEKVDWESLRANIAEFWEHLEPFAETVGEGLIIFIGRLADALANFINSPALSEFLAMIENWMDKVTPEDVADAFQKIATAIVALKVASVAFPAISTAFTVFSTAAGVLKGVLSLLSPVISILGNALSLLASPIGIAVAAIALLAAGFVYLYNHCESFKNSMDTLYNEHIKPFFDSIAEGVAELKDHFMEFWDGYVKPMLDEWGQKINTLWEEHLKPMLNNLAEFIGKVFDLLTWLWEEILKPVISWLIEVLAPTVADVCDIVFGVIDTAIALIADVINGIIDIVEGVIGILIGIATGDWQRVWDGFAEVIDGVAGVIKGIINGIIGVVEGVANAVVAAVNTMIRAINSINFTVPDWVPAVGGESVGFNIPEISKVSIPRLATGAVIPANKEFLAVLGDQKHGTNIEAPLDMLRQANEELLLKTISQLGLTGGGIGGNSQPIIIKWIADGKELTNLVINNGKVQQMSSGSNPFLLGTI